MQCFQQICQHLHSLISVVFNVDNDWFLSVLSAEIGMAANKAWPAATYCKISQTKSNLTHGACCMVPRQSC
jgi:hypothetical protein